MILAWIACIGNYNHPSAHCTTMSEGRGHTSSSGLGPPVELAVLFLTDMATLSPGVATDRIICLLVPATPKGDSARVGVSGRPVKALRPLDDDVEGGGVGGAWIARKSYCLISYVSGRYLKFTYPLSHSTCYATSTRACGSRRSRKFELWLEHFVSMSAVMRGDDAHCSFR
jgi:hypothetical protein